MFIMIGAWGREFQHMDLGSKYVQIVSTDRAEDALPKMRPERDEESYPKQNYCY